jgi:hypothetical protein
MQKDTNAPTFPNAELVVNATEFKWWTEPGRVEKLAEFPALLAPHPEWQGAYDQDGPLAVETRRKLIDRVIADKMMICGAHFPFPGAGAFAKDGGGYAFTPTQA